MVALTTGAANGYVKSIGVDSTSADFWVPNMPYTENL